MSIPTPIPQHLARIGAWLRNGPWLLRLYRLALFVAGFGLLYLALASSIAFVATVAGIAAGIILADDIRKTLSDLWNLNFWVFRV